MNLEPHQLRATASEVLRGEPVPYYQPIVSLHNRLIAGYECLGRISVGGEVVSLGRFFHDPRVTAAEQLAVDREIREKAIRRFARDGGNQALFLNVRPAWMVDSWRSSSGLRTLELLRRWGTDPKRVVIEITEDSFQGDPAELVGIVEHYRAHGCRIAVDDVGSGFSYLDRIALFRPEIIKLDIRLLKQSARHEGYRTLVSGFSLFAEQIGASLLVEGVETGEELLFCFDVGVRYVQGYFFAAAGPNLLPRDSFEES